MKATGQAWSFYRRFLIALGCVATQVQADCPQLRPEFHRLNLARLGYLSKAPTGGHNPKNHAWTIHVNALGFIGVCPLVQCGLSGHHHEVIPDG